MRLSWLERLLGSLPLPPKLELLASLLRDLASIKKRKVRPAKTKKRSIVDSTLSTIVCPRCGYAKNLKEFGFCGCCGASLKDEGTKIY